jgi:predicted amidophosphoribosyltransferase
MTNPIKAAYKDGICPDCGAEIPNDVEECEACHNCGHVFYPDYEDDDYDYNEDRDDDYDGQPDEMQEWHDFDPDC